jgi:hypothetical protein
MVRAAARLSRADVRLKNYTRGRLRSNRKPPLAAVMLDRQYQRALAHEAGR